MLLCAGRPNEASKCYGAKWSATLSACRIWFRVFFSLHHDTTQKTLKILVWKENGVSCLWYLKRLFVESTDNESVGRHPNYLVHKLPKFGPFTPLHQNSEHFANIRRIVGTHLV